jgi:uncharacterized protein (DUF1778 family)
MTQRQQRPRLSIEVDPDLRRRLKIAAARREVTVRGFVLAAVEQALAAEDEAAWSRVSELSFARDWDSESDAVYDRL